MQRNISAGQPSSGQRADYLLARRLQDCPRSLAVRGMQPHACGCWRLSTLGVEGAHTPRVQLLSRPGKLGLGTAYLAGFRHGLRAGYSFLCEMDADFSHQPGYLPQLLGRAEREADVVLGSRNVPGGRVELNYRCHQAGLRISELPIVFPDHVAGGSKMSRRIILEAVAN